MYVPASSPNVPLNNSRVSALSGELNGRRQIAGIVGAGGCGMNGGIRFRHDREPLSS
jgi:hypothetical protein